MTESMTSGSPIKLILKFSLPLLLGNLLQQMYNMIDAAIVGRVLGADALAGVGASSSVQFLVLGFCMGICAGFSIPVAKYFGAEHYERLRTCIFNAYLMTGAFAVLLTIPTALFCRNILNIMATPANIYDDAYIYLLIIFLGIPFILFYNLLAGIMRAVGDSRTPFIFLMITAIGSMVMQSANNGLGSSYVSGFTAASKIKQLAMCPFDAIATGVSVFTSQNLGAGKPERIRKGIFNGVAVGAGYGAVIGLVLIFFGRPLSLMFIKSSETAVLAASAQYLMCAGFFYWLLGILNTTRMTIQGLGYSAVAIFSGVIEMIARIAVSKAFVPKFGFWAICFTDQAAWILATIYCSIVCAVCIRKVSKNHTKLQFNAAK